MKKRILSILFALLITVSTISVATIKVSAATGYDRGYSGGRAGTGSIVAHGLDVSVWQAGNIDFSAVKAAGYSYVILRAGYSGKKDTSFETFYSQAKAAGLDVGAYFYSYATTVADAYSDAQDTLNYIAGKKFEYPIYFDYEDSTQANLSDSLDISICLAYLDTIASAGYLAGIYSGKYFLTQYQINTICAKYEYWIPHYYDYGYTAMHSEYSTTTGMYQYTDRNYVNGKGPYDGDVCYKDYPSIVKTYGFNGYSAGSWVQSEGRWYYKDASGNYVVGWENIGGKWYYFDQSGIMQTGWVLLSDKWYYFGTNGAMQTGWISYNGKWYYAKPDGSMQTGWIQEGDKWYYGSAEGSMLMGLQEIRGKIYYFYPYADNAETPQSSMLTGWQQVDGVWYYFGTDGDAQIGWIDYNGNKYYANSKGQVLTGWQEIDGEKYYFCGIDAAAFSRPECAMLNGTVVLNNKKYVLDESGRHLYTFADVDNDDNIGANDLSLLQRSLLKSITLEDKATSAADVNGDGAVDLKDMLRLKLYMADISIKIGN